MGWWKDKQKVASLVAVAGDLCDQYEGQNIVSIGHSPSWLVYAVGQMRKAQGQDPQVAFIPFSSGNFYSWQFSEHGSYFHFKYNSDSDYGLPNHETISSYFNILNAEQKNLLNIDEIASHSLRLRKKTVLIDFIRSGDGFISFLWALSQKTQCCNFEDYYHAHLFSFHRKTRDIKMTLATHSNQSIEIKGFLEYENFDGAADSMAGARGMIDDKSFQEGLSNEKYAGRFMPFCDLNKTFHPVAHGLNNQSDIREIKKVIRLFVEDYLDDTTFKDILKDCKRKWTNKFVPF